MTMHFTAGDIPRVCGARGESPGTGHALQVTCGRCKRHSAYKAAAADEVANFSWDGTADLVAAYSEMAAAGRKPEPAPSRARRFFTIPVRRG